MKPSTYYRCKLPPPKPLEPPFFTRRSRSVTAVVDSNGEVAARCRRRTAGMMVELLNKLVER